MARLPLAVLVAGLFPPAALVASHPPPPVGVKVADFTLPEPATGGSWSLADRARGARATVVVFTATACPVCTGYGPRLAELARQPTGGDVTWVAVASHPADDPDAVARYARDAGLPFPVLWDDGSALAGRLRVDRVPTALVLDAGRTVRYAGRIDDRLAPGVHKARAGTAELAAALAAVVKGEEVRVPYAAPAGCRLAADRAAPPGAGGVTYHRHVAPVLQAKCQECHRPGEAGPFPLTSYRQARDWAGMVREVVADGAMPPWHADAPRGHFRNDRRLSDDEKKTLLTWVDGGCVEGDPRDAPPPRPFVAGWRLGRTPDQVLTMARPVDVPATGTKPYEYVFVGEPFAEDKWVTAVEVRPDRRAVVHHVIAFVIPPGEGVRGILGPGFGRHMLGAYVPGDQPVVAGPGQARRIAKGSRVLCEIHYTPNGRAVADRTAVGLCYTPDPPAAELFALSVINTRFRIPAGAAGHEVTAEHRFPKAATLLSLTPHMHVRGKSFRYEVVAQGGKRKEVLNVPRYDFNWQETYDFAAPVRVPAGAVLRCTAAYDNSAGNPFNPDPLKAVGFGTMTTDEMMIGFALYHETK